MCSINSFDGNHLTQLLAQDKVWEVVYSIQSAPGICSSKPLYGNHLKPLLARGKLWEVVGSIQSAQACVLSTH